MFAVCNLTSELGPQQHAIGRRAERFLLATARPRLLKKSTSFWEVS